jgi:hypothetical protein
MNSTPELPERSSEIYSDAILYEFLGPALTPEEAGPRERHGRPQGRGVDPGTCSTSVLYEFTDPPGGLPLDSPEVAERERRRQQRASDLTPKQQPPDDSRAGG